jgi:hypothetical protein
MRTAVAALLLTLAACASASPDHRASPDPSTLTHEEIQAGAASNAFDLVRELRPAWLRVRGPKRLDQESRVSVYLDGMRLEGPDALSGIRTATIEEMRYLSAREAQARYGLDNTSGAILVRTRGG